jgi:hypothetical protein
MARDGVDCARNNFADCTANKYFSASHLLHERITVGALTQTPIRSTLAAVLSEANHS